MMHIPFDSWTVLHALCVPFGQIRRMEAIIMRITASIPPSRTEETQSAVKRSELDFAQIRLSERAVSVHRRSRQPPEYLLEVVTDFRREPFEQCPIRIDPPFPLSEREDRPCGHR